MNTPRDIFGCRSPRQLVDTGDAGEQRRVLTIRIDYENLSDAPRRSWFTSIRAIYRGDYVWSRAEVGDEWGAISFNDLSRVSACRLAGDRWVRDSGQLAIRVPSVVIPD
jgi:hypothetical protein